MARTLGREDPVIWDTLGLGVRRLDLLCALPPARSVTHLCGPQLAHLGSGKVLREHPVLIPRSDCCRSSGSVSPKSHSQAEGRGAEQSQEEAEAVGAVMSEWEPV